MTDLYRTSFCDSHHRLRDGKPVDHECFVLPTEALHAEKVKDTPRAHAVLSAWKKRRPHKGLRLKQE